jgi:heme exporter protein A
LSLVARDLTVARGGRRLVDELSFALPPGGALLVTGPNGAGKSSLLRVLAGLARPAGGTIERPERVALLTEQAALDPERTLGAALDFWARVDGGGDVTAALAAVGLGELADVPVRFLSTGQRRRAALARVVMARAALWLLDEPATGLDVGAVATLEALVAAHRAGGGIAVVATHQPLALPGAVEVRL